MRWIGALLFLLGPAVMAWAEPVVVEWEFDYVNVRSSPAGASVGQLSAGVAAELLRTEGDWALIRFPGGEGWVVRRSLQTFAEIRQPVPELVAPPVASIAEPVEGVATTDPETTPEQALPQPRDEVLVTAPGPVSMTTPAAEGTDAVPSGGYLSEYADAPDAPVFETGPSVVSVISGLCIVLALIAGTVMVVRRLWLNRSGVGRRPGGIQVLASRPVGPRQSLLLVEVGGLVWLVGQSQEGLRLIAPVEDDRALQRLNDRYEFLETPFESELKRSLDLESAELNTAPTDTTGEPATPTAAQRLEALRRRSKPRERS